VPTGKRAFQGPLVRISMRTLTGAPITWDPVFPTDLKKRAVPERETPKILLQHSHSKWKMMIESPEYPAHEN